MGASAPFRLGSGEKSRLVVDFDGVVDPALLWCSVHRSSYRHATACLRWARQWPCLTDDTAVPSCYGLMT
jgi:hypothetical protein